MKQFDENKFIVISRKRLEELNYFSLKAVDDFLDALEQFKFDYESFTGKKLDQNYIVCNQDEPYAEEIKNIILSN